MSQNNTNNGKPDNHLQGLLNHDDNSSGNSSKTESDNPTAESSMLSLSLRPRNNPVDKDNNVPIVVNSTNNRLPLQMTEIEPHYSRDLTRSIKQEERPKTPPQPAPQPLQVDIILCEKKLVSWAILGSAKTPFRC